MDRQRRKRIFGAMVGLLISMCWSSEAQAAPLASYRILDLGEGTYEIQTMSDGSSVIARADDVMYAFPRSLKDTEEAIAVQKSFPPFTDKPTNLGYPNDYYAYSRWADNGLYSPLLSANGVFLGTNVRGVDGRDTMNASAVLASQLQADGTFSPLVRLWTSMVGKERSIGAFANAIYINKYGQIIGTGMYYSSPGGWFSESRGMGLYDLNTHKIDFQFDNLTPDWIPTTAKIDDEGRILVYAKTSDGHSLHSLLMLPEGVSAEVVPVPEASTLATLLAGVAGMAYQGMKRRTRAIRR